MARRVGTALLLLVFTVGAAEVLLRLWPPLGIRVQGDRIVLPTDVDDVIRGSTLPGTDATIHLHRNHLGLRGPDLPHDTTGLLRIVAVGGSTTECMYLSDGQDWPTLLGTQLSREVEAVWVNNAGLDGHSTFGHAILLKDLVLPLRPHVVLLLVGANDLGRSDLGRHDRAQWRRTPAPWSGRSAIVRTWRAWRQARSVREAGIGHRALELSADPAPTAPDSARMQVSRERALLPNYRSRLEELIALCRTQGALPVLLTQPCIAANVMDTALARRLQDLPLLTGTDGRTLLERLDLINSVTRAVATEQDLLLIDLARELPGGPANFYDAFHFTKAGSAAVAALCADRLTGYLSARFPQHLTH
ncbi:MAG TPA: SGNH/GDSL hydrolase family protein [Flavobacteriales bacterium]|nr:SGNH/GDSL hydrolase family protein [Flavobacteriales bacterium]HMR27714.1 SGNH/GDSL hydrolase family protein [Flavobacteriales bacterium]